MKTSEEFKSVLNSTSSGKVTAIMNEINMAIEAHVEDKPLMSYFHNAQIMKECMMRWQFCQEMTELMQDQLLEDITDTLKKHLSSNAINKKKVSLNRIMFYKRLWPLKTQQYQYWNKVIEEVQRQHEVAY